MLSHKVLQIRFHLNCYFYLHVERFEEQLRGKSGSEKCDGELWSVHLLGTCDARCMEMKITTCSFVAYRMRSDKLWHRVMKPGIEQLITFGDIFETINVIDRFQTSMLLA